MPGPDLEIKGMGGGGMGEGGLPVHIILGAADIHRVQSIEPPILGLNPNTDPGEEFTMLGSVIAGYVYPSLC